MNWQIDFSKEAIKFMKNNNIDEDNIISLLIKTIRRLKGECVNIDIKKMRGEWKDFYRIRMGKIRILASMDFNNREAYIDRIDFRGNVYK
jgi:mRNA interferase RelE/StbE